LVASNDRELIRKHFDVGNDHYVDEIDTGLATSVNFISASANSCRRPMTSA